jgi:hypothetical protein
MHGFTLPLIAACFALGGLCFAAASLRALPEAQEPSRELHRALNSICGEVDCS